MGAHVSWNTGQTWSDLDFPTAQIYRLSVTNVPLLRMRPDSRTTHGLRAVSARPGELGTATSRQAVARAAT
jgi:hypothetical protein